MSLDRALCPVAQQTPHREDIVMTNQYPPGGGYPPQPGYAPQPQAPAYPPQQQYPQQPQQQYPQQGYGAPAQPPPPAQIPGSFDGAKPKSSGGDYLEPGIHDCTIRKCKLTVSEKPKSYGHTFAHIEMVVDGTQGLDGGQSLRNWPGQEVSVSADLNGYGGGDLKAWIAQIMAGNPNEVSRGHVEWVCGADNPFGGTKVRVVSKTNAKGSFTHHKFTVLEPGPRLAAIGRVAGAQAQPAPQAPPPQAAPAGYPQPQQQAPQPAPQAPPQAPAPAYPQQPQGQPGYPAQQPHQGAPQAPPQQYPGASAPAPQPYPQPGYPGAGGGYPQQ